MSASRRELEEELSKYVSDTFSYLKTVKNLFGRSSEWIKEREEETCSLVKVQEKACEITNRFSQVKKAKTTMDKTKAFFKMVGNSMIPGRTSKQQAEEEKKLQMELEALMRRILEGLDEMQPFLEAVEKLAVTSEPVFDQNQVLQLSGETDLESVKKILFAAQILCPCFLLFKRNNKSFFKAKLHNVEVMETHLNQYIGLIRYFCDVLKKCSVADLCLNEPSVSLKPGVTEDDIGNLLIKINTIDQIRKDKDFRMMFLFQDEYRTFMEKFSEKNERMQKFLTDLEPCAGQLDKMNKGARISNVVSSSVGAVGGGLSIAGLALIPVTAGVSLSTSLGLIIAGAPTAGTCALNSVVTMLTEKGVNSSQKNKANETFKEFMKDVNDLENCILKVINDHFNSAETSDTLTALKMTGKGVALRKSIDAISDCASVIKLLKAEKAAAASGKGLSQAASDIPGLGKSALKGPLAMGKAARGGFITLNTVFIVLDIFTIASEGMSLSQGSETETSKWIRARAGLWRSEVKSLQRIYDSLKKGQNHFHDKKQVLQNPF